MGETYAKPLPHDHKTTRAPLVPRSQSRGDGALELLQEISRELTAILDRQELLRRIGERVRPLADYQLFSLMTWNEESQQLEHAFSLRFGKEIQVKKVLQLGEGLCGTAALERKPVRVADVRLDPRYLQCDFGTGVRSELVVPLLAGGKLVGVLDLESTSHDAFTEENERMLATLAPYVAIALENARLYEELREKERRLEQDMATARDIQAQLLPDRPTDINGLEVGVGYAPARQLGGDFYDFPGYGDGQFALAVGDVAGKGTAAALYGALAVGTLREHVAEHPCAPAEMLALLNQRLLRSAVEGRFVALLFGVYDTERQVLRLANAGFPRPLVLRDSRLQAIRVEGVPLGLLPDMQYDEIQITLKCGDVILLCSDGIHEAMNQCEEEFGETGLNTVIAELARDGSAQRIADGILEAAGRHSAPNGGPGDDRTIVVLKVGENALREPTPSEIPLW